MHHKLPTLRLTTLAHAATCLGLVLQMQAAMAQNMAFDIPAQPLAPALGLFARQAGLQLVFTPALAQGKTTTGIAGTHDLHQALGTLLKGSGLQGQVVNGTLTVQPVATTQRTLAEVRVEARRASNGTTEGTGSYTSQITSIASKTDQSFREIPQSVSVVTRQQIEDQHLVDINDSLKLTPGITLQRAGFNSFNFYARGFQITSLQTDGGAPLTLGSFSYDAQQNMAFYDRVEVMRGASGLLGGVGDPGGIINLVRKKPLAERQVVAEVSAGRWNNHRMMLDATGPLGFEGRLRGRAVTVYENRDTHLLDRSVETPQIYGVLEADLAPNTLLTVGGSYGKQKDNGYGSGLPRYSDGGDIGLPRNTSLTQPWAFNDRDVTELFAQVEHRFANNWKLKANLAHSATDLLAETAFVSGAVNPRNGTGPLWGGGRYDVSNRQNVADINLSGTFGLLGRTHEFLAGADWQKVKGDWATGKPTDNWQVPADVFTRNLWNPDMHVPINYRFNPWNQEQKGLYGVLRLHPTDRLHLIAGARVSRYTFTQTTSYANAEGVLEVDSSTPFSEPTKVTPYGGVIYDLNDKWSAYVSYSSIFKPQALLKAGPLPGTSLAPIRGNSYETGVKGELLEGRLNATFSVFNVERTGTGVVDERYPATDYPWAGSCCYLPQGKVTSRGFDMEVGGELQPGWQLAAGYTFNKTKDKSTNTDYSSITPRHLLKLSTAYTLPGEWSQWKIGGSANVQSKTHVRGTIYDAAAKATPYKFAQSGYAVWNAMAQYRIDPKWTVTLNVNNLLDRVYYDTVGSAISGNYYGTPRSWMLTLRGQF